MTLPRPFLAVVCALLTTLSACARSSTVDTPASDVSGSTASIATTSDVPPPEAVPVRLSEDPESLWHHITVSIVTDDVAYVDGQDVKVTVQWCNTRDEVLTVVSPSIGGNDRFDIVHGTTSVANDHDGNDFAAAVSYTELLPGCLERWSFSWNQRQGRLRASAEGSDNRGRVAPRGTYRVVYSATTSICRGDDPTYRQEDLREEECDPRHPDDVSSNEFTLR